MAKSASKSKQNYSALYKSSNRWKSNRERKLQKLLKEQPNNKQIELALKDVRYRRKTPGVNGSWSKTNIQIAKLFKLFTGKASHDLFSSNDKVQQAAIAMHGNRQHKPQTNKVSFTLGARAHDKRGALVWG